MRETGNLQEWPVGFLLALFCFIVLCFEGCASSQESDAQLEIQRINSTLEFTDPTNHTVFKPETRTHVPDSQQILRP